jgi:hypothetical protein
MRQRQDLPDYRVCSIKIQMDLLEKLIAEAKQQERSLAGEVAFRLRRSFEAEQAEGRAA